MQKWVNPSNLNRQKQKQKKFTLRSSVNSIIHKIWGRDKPPITELGSYIWNHATHSRLNCVLILCLVKFDYSSLDRNQNQLPSFSASIWKFTIWHKCSHVFIYPTFIRYYGRGFLRQALEKVTCVSPRWKAKEGRL